MRFNSSFSSFNGGEIGREVQGRTSLEGYGATASILENILPEGAGPMTFRRGLAYKVASPTPTTYTHLHPFVYRLNQKYVLMFTNNALRIVENGGIVVTQTVSASVLNPTFNTLSNWDNYCVGTSTASGVNGTGLTLYCDGPNPAGVRQDVGTGSTGQVHTLAIEVTRGPALLRIGTTGDGSDDILGVTELRTGTHRISFIPSGTFWIDLGSSVRRDVIVSSCSLSTAGDLALTTPWTYDKLRALRFRQDLNVMNIADGERKRRRLERRGSTSWSLVLADEKDGPFLPTNLDETVTITPSTRQGNGTLSASKPLFKATDVGSLVKLTQNGQYVQRVIASQDQWSDPVRVVGVGSARSVTWQVSGTYSGTVRLQRSVGNDSTWEDVTNTDVDAGDFSTTTTGTFAYQDGQDNSVIYYRVGIKLGEYTSGNPGVTLYFAGGATDGIARITSFTSRTLVSMEVLTSFSALSQTSEWAKGAWSDELGWPKGITVYDGRLWSGFSDKFWGSVSNSFESLHEGDETADAVARSVGVGDQAPHILGFIPLGRLIALCEGSEVGIRSNNLDDPISTTALTVREMSTYGSADINPVKIDDRGIYIDRSGTKPMEIVWDGQKQDYIARPLTRLHRDIGRLGIKQIAIARQPESRLFMVRDDGQALAKLFDPGENTLGWSRIKSPGASGSIESVCVLPATGEDEVYFMVKRTVNGLDRRNLEQMDPMYLGAVEDHNGLDSYVRYESGGATNIPLTFAAHLIGQTVKVWADGAYMGTNTIAMNGQLTTPLASNKQAITVGLDYEGRYRSSKLAMGARAGTAMAQKGQPKSMALMLLDSVTAGIRMGGTFTGTMDPLPFDRSGEDLTYDTTAYFYDELTTKSFTIPADMSRDPRLCLKFEAPFPVTMQGYALAHHLDEVVNA